LNLGRGSCGKNNVYEWNIGIELVPNGCDCTRKAANQIDSVYDKKYQYINLII
jgi:hypothetical protein